MAGFRSLFAVLVCGAAVSLLLPADQRLALDLGFVETGHGFSVMRHEVTVAQWNACAAAGACSFSLSVRPADQALPATGIGALDAQAFVDWAQTSIDPALRLPTKDEWYAFSGVKPVAPTKLFTDPRLAWAATYGSEGKVDPTLRPSGGFGVNEGGIADVTGNVWEWTSTCIAVMPAAEEVTRCPGYFAAGEHVAKVPVFVRDPSAGGCATGTPPAHLGFRLVRDDAPIGS